MASMERPPQFLRESIQAIPACALVPPPPDYHRLLVVVRSTLRIARRQPALARLAHGVELPPGSLSEFPIRVVHRIAMLFPSLPPGLAQLRLPPPESCRGRGRARH